MQYRQEKIIYIPDKSKSEIIEKLKNDLSKKCDLVIDDGILILISRVRTGAMGVFGIRAQITATVETAQSGSVVTAIAEKPPASRRYLLVVVSTVFVLCCLWLSFRNGSISHFNTESLFLSGILFGGLFFDAYRTDKMLAEQTIKLKQYLEDALKPY